MSAVTFDERCWPLLLATFPERPMSDSEWVEFLDALDVYQGRSGSLLLVFNVTGTNHLPNAKQRALIAEKTADSDVLKTEAFVVMPSAAIRAITQAIQWLSRRDHKINFYSCLEDAVAGAVARAREKGLSLRADPDVLLQAKAGAG